MRVFGAQRLSAMAGAFVVQDLISGWSCNIPLRCHHDLLPSTWGNFTTALNEGLNVMAAVDLVSLVDVTSHKSPPPILRRRRKSGGLET